MSFKRLPDEPSDEETRKNANMVANNLLPGLILLGSAWMPSTSSKEQLTHLLIGVPVAAISFYVQKKIAELLKGRPMSWDRYHAALGGEEALFWEEEK